MKKLYYVLFALSIVCIILSFTVFRNTTMLGPITIVIGIYLLLGSIIKLCKQNDKLKSTILCALDLLFWLP